MIVVIAVIVAAFLAALIAFHWYAWRRLVRDTLRRGSVARRVGTVVFAAGPVLMVGAAVSEPAGLPFWLVRVLAWPGYLWMAVCLYLLLALLVGELVRPVLRWWLARRDAAAAEAEGGAESGVVTGLSRRVFVARVVGGAVAATTVGTVGYGTYSLFSGPRVQNVTVPLAKLPRSANGFRIALVSDLHLGPVLGRDFAQHVVNTINGTQPDLIAVVGDLVDGDVDDLAPAVAPLAQLRARHGTYFVTGNHEYFSGAAQWVEHVQELGMHLLANSRLELPAFDLAGVNDVQGGSDGQGPDFTKALGDRDRSRTAVLLAHQPIVIDDAVAHGADLQLSGHTHGGQMWPLHYVMNQIQPTGAGLERYGDTQLYVTRGAGSWGPPVRVGAPSDITVIELASTQA